ncbi:MAG: PEP-CTERM sorting domain-containing protein [Phycisphaerae bacterium]|nr:PEP-CTERM sorting domain-containing protein [Phycisphaerae bacterium]
MRASRLAPNTWIVIAPAVLGLAAPLHADQNYHVGNQNVNSGYLEQFPFIEADPGSGSLVDYGHVTKPYTDWQSFGLSVKLDGSYMMASVNGNGSMAAMSGVSGAPEYVVDGIAKPWDDWSYRALATRAQSDQYAVAFSRPSGGYGIQFLTINSGGATQTGWVDGVAPYADWDVRGITELPSGNLAILYKTGNPGYYRILEYSPSGGAEIQGFLADVSAPSSDWDPRGLAYQPETGTYAVMFQTGDDGSLAVQRRTSSGDDLGWVTVTKPYGGDWDPVDLGTALDSEVTASASGINMGTVIKGAYGGTYAAGQLTIANDGFNLDYTIPASAGDWALGDAGSHHMTYAGSAVHALSVSTDVVGSKDALLTVTTNDPTGGEDTLSYALTGMVLDHSQASLDDLTDLDSAILDVLPGVGVEIDVTIYNIGDADLDIDSAFFDAPGLFEFVGGFSPVVGIDDAVTFTLRRLTTFGDALLTFGVSDEDLPGATSGTSLTIALVPEPTTLALIGVAMAGLIRRRRSI